MLYGRYIQPGFNGRFTGRWLLGGPVAALVFLDKKVNAAPVGPLGKLPAPAPVRQGSKQLVGVFAVCKQGEVCG